MTTAQATADVFWTAFRALSRKEQHAFLEKLSTDEDIIEILEDLRYGRIADQRKKESRRSLDDILARRAKRRGSA
jgi:hypothetical protein